jgi:superfamily II DNA or RNA helicase
MSTNNTGYALRPYQQKAITESRKVFASGAKSFVLSVPTGGGKTVIFSTMAVGAISRGKRVMIICDRKELIRQANEKLRALGLMPTIIAPKYKQAVNFCYLASVDTLIRRDFPEIDILIIDEAHKSTFDKVIDKYKGLNPNLLIIGATATPLRTGKQRPLSDFYEEIIEPTNIADLINSYFLVPVKTISVRQDFSNVAMSKGEFDPKALLQKFQSTELFSGMVDNYEKFAFGKKALCFNVSVEHSLQTRDRFLDRGISAEHLDGNTPELERIDRLERFSRGEFLVLCNCSVLTTGYDEPSVECVIVNRATMSLALWLQMVGRVARIFEGKELGILIDQGANVYRHGLWEESRTWSLFKKPKREGSGVAPVKNCPSCQAINYASAALCKICGVVFPKEEKKLKEAVFVEVTRGLLRRDSNEDLKRIAKERGYKNGWLYHKMKGRGIG